MMDNQDMCDTSDDLSEACDTCGDQILPPEVSAHQTKGGVGSPARCEDCAER